MWVKVKDKVGYTTWSHGNLPNEDNGQFWLICIFSLLLQNSLLDFYILSEITMSMN